MARALGWIHIKNERTAYTNYYKKMKEGDDVWPPKFWKFHLTTTDKPVVEVAFTDPRRLARVRLVNCPGESIRKHSPLAENGPDPVVDADLFTEDFLKTKLRARRVPIKALLLDQKFLSGIGNWVGDEVLYHARLHPEQYCNEFSDEQMKKLYDSIRYVCQFAVDKLGDSDQFPDDWMFHHRWGKGPKGAGQLPSGEKLAFLTVGGRTSCYAPGLQKKTGHVAPGIKEEPIESEEEDPKPKKQTKAKPTSRKRALAVKEDPEDSGEEEAKAKPKRPSRARTARAAKVEDEQPSKRKTDVEDEAPRKRTRGRGK